MEKKIRGMLLDVDYRNIDEKSTVRVFVKTSKGIEFFEDARFKPYFYVKADNAREAAKKLLSAKFSDGAKIAAVEESEKQGQKVLKLVFNKTEELTKAREEVLDTVPGIERFEYDIPFAKRYLIDSFLEPMNGIEVSLDNNGSIRDVKKDEAGDVKWKIAAFDLETFAPERFSDARKDPIIMASIAGDKTRVLTYGKKVNAGFVRSFRDEKEMISGLIKELQENIDIIVTYNGDMFDWPYLKQRCKEFGLELNVSADNTEPREMRKGLDTAVRLKGKQHLDAYQMLRFLSRFGVVNLIKYDLESVLEKIFGLKKEKIAPAEINRIWKQGKGLERLAEYNRDDSVYSLKLAEEYLPLLTELSKLVKQTLFDVSRATASNLVEYLLINKAFESNSLVPNKPSKASAKQRMMQTYKGGFVREPMPGLHERIAVLDFSSLHPTIMISHNVSPENLDCMHEECMKNKEPNGHHFCTKKEGFLSSTLKELFETRMKAKRQLKEIDKKDKGYNIVNARQHALKILMNSFYGYLGFARSRWYSRECATAVTAWSREYVQEVGKKAEGQGFKVLYSDTDSEFLIIPKEKTNADVKRFVESINASLPGVMNLELENFYKRGIFVTKETGEGAKKKYALMDYDGNLKIVGFEYVRRDWAPIARETQREVLAAILKEGKPEKAISIVKENISALKQGKVPKEKLAVMTQIRRPLDKYAAIGPHVAAAKKAAKRGKHIEVGSVVSYIVTRTGKSISDKAELEEYVKEGNYDADYYITHQVVPAVIKIIRELGRTKEDLIHGGKQSSLGSFC